MSDLLSLERNDGGVYTLTIRRPEVRNALNEQAFHELIAACEQVGADNDARVLVLIGEGRAFSAADNSRDIRCELSIPNSTMARPCRWASAGFVSIHSTARSSGRRSLRSPVMA